MAKKKLSAEDMEAAAGGSLTGKRKAETPRYRDSLKNSTSAVKTEKEPIRVMLTLYPEQKVFVDALAEEFKRKRDLTSKQGGDIINRNTIIRALIDLLSAVNFSDEDRANTEEELKEIFRRRLSA